MIENGWVMSGIWSMGAEEKICLSLSNAVVAMKSSSKAHSFLLED